MNFKTRLPFVVTDGVLGIGIDIYRLDRGRDKEIATRPAPTEKGYTEEEQRRAKEIVNGYDKSFFLTGEGTEAQQRKEEENRVSLQLRKERNRW